MFRLFLYGIIAALFSGSAQAHVKWFSDYSQNPEPANFQMLLHPDVIAITLFAMSMIFLSGMIQSYFGNTRFQFMEKFTPAERARKMNLALAVAVAIAFFLNYNSGVIFTPETISDATFVRYVQFLMVVLSIIPSIRSKALVAGFVALFVYSCTTYGVVHMLDYLHTLGIAWFLFFSDPYSKEPDYRKAMSGLYILTGFSLAWLGMEKLIYPNWANEVLYAEPALAMGFDHDFFVRGSALVEFSVGFMFMTQKWSRLLATILFGIMVTTALFFGTIEVKGHLLLHVILLMFIFDQRPSPATRNIAAAAKHGAMVAALFLVSFAFIMITYYETATWKFLNNSHGIAMSKFGAVFTLITLGAISYISYVRSQRLQQEPQQNQAVLSSS